MDPNALPAERNCDQEVNCSSVMLVVIMLCHVM